VPQLQDAAQPLPYLLYQHPWTPLGLLGHHPIGSGIQEPNPNYFDTDTYYKNEPISLPGDLKDMATIFACLTLLLIGADACIPHIINSVWGEDDDARLALGGPRGDLSLIRRRLLTLFKVAIDTIHIWLTDPTTPILAPTSDSYDHLPSTFGTYYSTQVTNLSSHANLFPEAPSLLTY